MDGAILYKQPTPWHHEQADAIKHIQSNLEYIPEKPYAGIVCSSLCNCNIEEPDVICLQLPTQAPSTCWPAMSRPTGRSSSSPFSGESNCADTWMRTMKDGKIGLSLGCRGDRATGALGYGDVRVTMTTEQLIKRSTAATRSRRTTFSTLQPDLPLQVCILILTAPSIHPPPKTKLPPRSLGGSFALRSALEFAAIAFRAL